MPSARALANNAPSATPVSATARHWAQSPRRLPHLARVTFRQDRRRRQRRGVAHEDSIDNWRKRQRPSFGLCFAVAQECFLRFQKSDELLRARHARELPRQKVTLQGGASSVQPLVALSYAKRLGDHGHPLLHFPLAGPPPGFMQQTPQFLAYRHRKQLGLRVIPVVFHSIRRAGLGHPPPFASLERNPHRAGRLLEIPPVVFVEQCIRLLVGVTQKLPTIQVVGPSIPQFGGASP